MDADDLLKTISVLPYLEGVQEAGVGSSGVLHRIIAHKAAVHFTEEEEGGGGGGGGGGWAGGNKGIRENYEKSL